MPGKARAVAAMVTVWVGLLAALGGARPTAAASLDLLVVPDLVEIGAFFHGHRVQVSGKIPPGTEAVLEVLGRSASEKLMRKGRRGGLWMNVGELEIKGAPSLYLVMSTKAGLLSADTQAPWGYPALKSRIAFSGQIPEEGVAEFQKQFLELKESEGLYASLPGALKATPGGEGWQKVQGNFQLPANVKPDTYQVYISVIRDGQVMERQRADLQVVMGGVPALLLTLAYQHGALYGIVAVVIAIVTGFLMGYLFKGGGGH